MCTKEAFASLTYHRLVLGEACEKRIVSQENITIREGQKLPRTPVGMLLRHVNDTVAMHACIAIRRINISLVDSVLEWFHNLSPPRPGDKTGLASGVMVTTTRSRAMLGAHFPALVLRKGNIIFAVGHTDKPIVVPVVREDDVVPVTFTVSSGADDVGYTRDHRALRRYRVHCSGRARENAIS